MVTTHVNDELILDTKAVETPEEITQEVQKNENVSKEENAAVTESNLQEILKSILAQKTTDEIEQLKINKEKADKLDRQERAKEYGVNIDALEEVDTFIKDLMESKDKSMFFIEREYNKAEEKRMEEATKEAERKNALVVRHGEMYQEIYKPALQKDLNKVFGDGFLNTLEKHLPRRIYSQIVDSYVSKTMQYGKEAVSDINNIQEPQMTEKEWLAQSINLKELVKIKR